MKIQKYDIDTERGKAIRSDSGTHCYACPKCNPDDGETICPSYNFCPYCGEKIDWIEANG